MLEVDPTFPENILPYCSFITIYIVIVSLFTLLFSITLHTKQLSLKHSYLGSRAAYKYPLIDSDEGHKYLNQIALRVSTLLLLKLTTIYLCTCSHQAIF